jgi:hypothetical protein
MTTRRLMVVCFAVVSLVSLWGAGEARADATVVTHGTGYSDVTIVGATSSDYLNVSRYSSMVRISAYDAGTTTTRSCSFTFATSGTYDQRAAAIDLFLNADVRKYSPTMRVSYGSDGTCISIAIGYMR